MFGIGIYEPKTKENIGTLWRTAYQLGANYIFMINARYKKQSSDTYKTWTKIPLFQYQNWSSFIKSRPYNAKLLGVEFNRGESTCLTNFNHPKNAIYLLGSEDVGLPKKVINVCTELISIPSVREASYNVAVSGAFILMDRFNKRRK